MKVLISYTAIAVDNCQGGRGETMNMNAIADIANDLPVAEIWGSCLKCLKAHKGPFPDENIQIRQISIFPQT